MAEYLPLFTPGQAVTRQTSAAIVGGQLVGVSGPGLVAPSAGAIAAWFGVAAFDAAIGEQVTVHTEGVQRIIANGTITAGQNVEPSVNGTVVAHTNGTNDVNIVGLALTSVTVGQLVEVALNR